MKSHYTNEHSSAEVINPDLPESMRGVMEVVRVWTDPEHRKQGYATELMQTIIKDADIEGVVLMLNPRTFGAGGGLENLAPWYERFGFMVIQKKPVVLMARMPQVYKAKFSVIAGAASEVANG